MGNFLSDFGSGFGDALGGGLGSSLFGSSARSQEKRSQKMAREQMAFQASQATTAYKRSAAGVLQNYTWGRDLANTAVRRNVTDMKAAGLNPILAAGGGAPTPMAGSPAVSAPSGAAGTAQDARASRVQSFATTALLMAQVRKMDSETVLTQTKDKALTVAATTGKDVGSLWEYLKQKGIKSVEEIQRVLDDWEQGKSQINPGKKSEYMTINVNPKYKGKSK